MRFTTSQSLLLLFRLFTFAYIGEGLECGTHELTEEEMGSAEARLQDYLGRFDGGVNSLPRQQTVIDTYWHVIHDGSTGRLSQGDIRAAISVLNEDFANSGSNFQYNLVGTTYTNSRRWFNTGNSGDYFAMSQALREGDCSTANIYSSGLYNNILGFINYFPFEVSNNCAGNYVDDGIWIRYDTIPGGTPPYNQGKTLVHEVGHWMGLFHTFQGCFGPGDYVDDTPPERIPNYGCPSSRNTCPGGGPDPINNYMDYSDDACVTEFTSGQVDRMLAQFNAFRARDDGGGDDDGSGDDDGVVDDDEFPLDVCYSPLAMATVKGKGKVAMKDLTVGDDVLTASGQYEIVYTINHYHTSKPTIFMQINTEMVSNKKENPLELSPMHLVYIDGEDHPVPAKDVQVGDYVETIDYGPQKVIDIKVITRNGLYNPITRDGTMLVDGVVTSSYTSFTGSAYLEIAGNQIVSVHNLLDVTIAPYRAFCMSTSFLNICNQHGEGELPVVVQLLSKFYDFWSEQNIAVQVIIISIYAFVFYLINLLLDKYSMIVLILSVVLVAVKRGNVFQKSRVLYRIRKRD